MSSPRRSPSTPYRPGSRSPPATPGLRMRPVIGSCVWTCATDALPVAPWEVASTSGRIWATSRPGDVLVEIDARTGTMLSMSTVPGAAPLTAWDRGDGVTTAGELVLVASSEAVHRFDPVGT